MIKLINSKTIRTVSFNSFIFLFIALLFTANYGLSLLPVRFDITTSRRYTITEATKKVLKDLEDTINIKVYMSTDLPTETLTVKQELRDLLFEYRLLAGSKLKVSYFSPETENDKQKAVSLGIPPLQFNNVQRDKYEVSQGFFGLAVLYNDRKEVIPMINSANLEYDLTSTIAKVARKETPQIAFSTGHSEPTAEEGGSIVNQLLKKDYLIETVDLKSGFAVPGAIKTLIINGPKSEFSDLEIYALDQFLLAKGRLLFLLDGVTVNNNLQAEKSSHGLFGLLNQYSLKLNPNLVIDAVSGIAPFSSGYSTFYTPYPFWPKIGNDGFNQKTPITKGLETALFPWVSTVEVTPNEGQAVTDLTYSSPKSYLIDSNFDLSPQQTYKFNNGLLNKYLVSTVIEGNFTSYFKGKVLPKNIKDKSKFIERTDDGKIILVGDSDFVNDGIISNNRGNMILFMNMVDYLSQGTDLFSIRSKGVTERPLTDLSDRQRTVIRYLNIFGAPVLVTAFGLINRYLRNRRKYSLSL